MHQIRFRLGLRQDPAGGAYSAPPDPLTGFKGPTSKERGAEFRGRMGRGGQGREREGALDLSASLFLATGLVGLDSKFFRISVLGGCHGQVGVQDFRSARLELINIGICGLMSKAISA